MEEEFKVVRKKKNDDLNKLIIKAKEDSSAQFQLGVKYYNGDGVEQSYEEAVKWFTKSAENGHSQAQYNLAVMYEDGEGVKQNIDEAVKWYKESAKNGNNDSIEALKELGIDYKKEPTTPEEQFQFANDCYKEKKYEEAIKWCKKSAEQGHTKAQHTLAKMYYKGQGVKQDYEESFKWFGKSIENGTAKDQYDLGMRYYKGNQVKQDYEEALKWFEKSAKQGHIEAQYNLGTIYYNGNIVEQNYEEAIKWFIKSAEQGNSKAQYNLGAMYEAGEGVKENIEEAIKWYKKSADQGDEDAKEALKELEGDKSDEELVVFVDDEEENKQENSIALNLLNEEDTKIKKQNDEAISLYKLGFQHYEDGDYKEAFNYFLKSAQLDNVKAQFNLATMYEAGEGVEEDIEQAKKWYKIASDNGDKDAKEALKELGVDEKQEREIRDLVKLNNISFLNYNDSLKVIKNICKISEDYNSLSDDSEIQKLNEEIKRHEEHVKEIKEGKAGCSNVVGIIAGIIALIAWIMIKTGSDGGVDIGCIALLLMMLGGLITFFSKLFGKKGLEKQANEYIRENIDPIKQKMSTINKNKQDFLQKEEAQWAIKMVGDDIFFNVSAINALSELLKNGEAHNLQEAINIYRR